MADIKDYQQYISQHVFNQAETSDITVKVFNNEYKLHKVFLMRSPFFEKLFQWEKLSSRQTPKSNSDGNEGVVKQESDIDKGDEYDKDYEDDTTAVSTDSCNFSGFEPIIIKKQFSLKFDDPYITETSFDLILRRLYHIENDKEEQKNFYNCLATANYLGLDSMVEQLVSQSKKISNVYKALECLKFFDSRVVGSNSLYTLYDISKFWLFKDGWEIGPEKWDDVSFSIVTEILKSDLFFVPNEYDRSIFIMKLIERKLEKGLKNESDALKEILNKDILFPSIPAKQIWELRHYQDKNHEPYVDKDIALQSVWNQLALSISIDMINTETGKLEYFNFDSPPTYAYVEHSLSESLPSLSYFKEFLETKRDTFSNLPTSKICPIRMSFAFTNLDDLSSNMQGVKAKDFSYGGATWRLTLDHFIPGRLVFRLSTKSSFQLFKDTKEIPFVYENNINYMTTPKSYFHLNDLDEDSKLAHKSFLNNKFKLSNLKQSSSCSYNFSFDRNNSPNAYMKAFIFGSNQKLMLNIVEPTVYCDGSRARFNIEEKDLKVDGVFVETLKICLLIGLV